MHNAGDYSPTVLFPAAIRASLTRVISEPTTGDEQDVPKTSSNSPSMLQELCHQQLVIGLMMNICYPMT